MVPFLILIDLLTHDPFGKVQVTHNEDGVVHEGICPIVGFVLVHLIVLTEDVIAVSLAHEGPGVGEGMATKEQLVSRTPEKILKSESICQSNSFLSSRYSSVLPKCPAFPPCP